MAIEFNDSPTLHDHRLKSQRLVFDASIVANGTPADKSESSDLPGVAYVRTEGRTSAADAVEDVSGQLQGAAAADATGIFQILLDVPDARKVYSVSVSPDVGTATSQVSVTSAKNLLVEVDSNQDLSSQDLTVTVSLDYLEE